jgi:hypothetical protein
MTPKEKAKELFNKYYLLIDIKNYENTKNCALIAVDEILESNPYKILVEGKFLTEHITYDIKFWKEVRKEIEAL